MLWDGKGGDGGLLLGLGVFVLHCKALWWQPVEALGLGGYASKRCRV